MAAGSPCRAYPSYSMISIATPRSTLHQRQDERCASRCSGGKQGARAGADLCCPQVIPHGAHILLVAAAVEDAANGAGGCSPQLPAPPAHREASARVPCAVTTHSWCRFCHTKHCGHIMCCSKAVQGFTGSQTHGLAAVVVLGATGMLLVDEGCSSATHRDCTAPPPAQPSQHPQRIDLVNARSRRGQNMRRGTSAWPMRGGCMCNGWRNRAVQPQGVFHC
jgi:hypothetical protein